MYSSDASPSMALCIDKARVIGSSNPLIVTASVIPLSAKLSTWSFMSDCNGDMTTVSPCTDWPSMRAGNWNASDFPPPVGNIASNDLPSTAAWAARSCKGSPS